MFDYHTHTAYSDDCSVPMRDMIEAACQFGLNELAITDHYDPDYPDQQFPFDIDFDRYHKDLDRYSKEYQSRIKIVKGIEIGIQHGETMKKCSTAAHAYDYDVILGSFHCAEGYELYGNGFFIGRTVEESYIAFYQYMYNCLKSYKDYDILTHFNIIDRYSDRIPPTAVYSDIIDEILKVIIYDGKGIEINTSSYRYGLGDRTTPAKGILKRYKELGGEIITTGSDAHYTNDIGYKLDLAQEIIKSAGLRYLTTFDQRKPKFVKL